MYYRSIIFTKAPLLKAYRHRDRFQLVPFFYFKNAPFSEYTAHFPAFLEYVVDDNDNVDEVLDCEEEFKEKGMSQELIMLGRKVPSQVRVRKEILHLLSALTNFQFFEYSWESNCWGIQAPMKNVNNLNKEEFDYINNQTSHWTIRSYVYPSMAEDLKISKFTDGIEYYVPSNDPRNYFTFNPNLSNNNEISIPPYLDSVIESYFLLEDNEKAVVRQCIALLFEGIDLFDTKRSVSLLSIVSSIEGMAKIDWSKSGEGIILSPKKRFIKYLKTYVAGKSEDKFNLYYDKRSQISHEGVLFLSDIDVFGNAQKQNEDWLLRLEILQAARIALYNWLRFKIKEI